MTGRIQNFTCGVMNYSLTIKGNNFINNHSDNLCNSLERLHFNVTKFLLANQGKFPFFERKISSKFFL